MTFGISLVMALLDLPVSCSSAVVVQLMLLLVVMFRVYLCRLFSFLNFIAIPTDTVVIGARDKKTQAASCIVVAVWLHCETSCRQHLPRTSETYFVVGSR